MSKKTRYEENPWADDPPGKMRIIKDFLPSPAELARAERTKKITLSVSEDSLEFFKGQAAKYHVPYQVMIRRLLDEYTSRA